jgi:hypothetical protein
MSSRSLRVTRAPNGTEDCVCLSHQNAEDDGAPSGLYDGIIGTDVSATRAKHSILIDVRSAARKERKKFSTNQQPRDIQNTKAATRHYDYPTAPATLRSFFPFRPPTTLEA